MHPILGMEAYVAPGKMSGARRRRPRHRPPPHPAGDEQHGLAQPRRAVDEGAPGGLLLQAPRRPGVPQRPQRGPHRALRLPLGRSPPGAARGARRRRPGHRPLVPRGLRRPLLRGAAEPPRPQVHAGHPQARRTGAGAGVAAGRHARLALHRPRGRHQPRSPALHRHQRHDGPGGPLQARRARLLPGQRGGDGGALPGAAGGAAQHGRHHGALRRRVDLQPPATARPRPAARHDRPAAPRRPERRRPGAALRHAHAGPHRAPALRVERRGGDRLRGVLPDRARLRAVRAPAAHRHGRARQRRRQHHPLLPRDHRHRPDRPRPRLRALPQRRSGARCPTSTWTSPTTAATR